MNSPGSPKLRGVARAPITAFLGLVLGLLALSLFFLLREAPGPNKAMPASDHPTVPAAATAPKPGTQIPTNVITKPMPPTSPPADWQNFQTSRQAPADDIRQLEEFWSQFRQSVPPDSHRPILENRDLVRIWSGDNRDHIRLLPENFPAVSPDGLLLDRWGVPYHLHQMSSSDLDFRSAGPDRELFTDDDLVSTPMPMPREISALDFQPDPLPPPPDSISEPSPVDTEATVDFPTAPTDSPVLDQE